MLATIKAGNLALAFLLELCILAALGYWGWHTGSGTVARVALGIGLPLLAAVVWGMLLAPKAAFPLPLPAHLALKVAIFALAALALAAAGRPALAWVFAVIVALNLALLYVWRQ